MFFKAWLTILRTDLRGCLYGTKSSEGRMVNKLLVRVSAARMVWYLLGWQYRFVYNGWACSEVNCAGRYFSSLLMLSLLLIK